MITFSKRRIIFIIIVLAICWMTFNTTFCSINSRASRVHVSFESDDVEIKSTVSSINIVEDDINKVLIKIDGNTKELAKGEEYTIKTKNKAFITVPRNLDSIKIESVSGEISAYDLSANDIMINSVSGSIHGSDNNKPDDVTLNSVSGSIDYTTTTDNDFEAETVSGSVTVKSHARDINLKSVSGSLALDNEDSDSSFKFTTVSGSWQYDNQNGLGEIEISNSSEKMIHAETVSGSVKVY